MLTRIRIRSLRARLHPEMVKSLARRASNGSVEPDAERILTDFFCQLASVREMLWTDLDAAYEGDPAATSFEEVILAYPSLEAIAIQRLAHILYQAQSPAHPAHDDGMGARPHRHRHPSRARRSGATFSSITAPAWSSAKPASSARR